MWTDLNIMTNLEHNSKKIVESSLTIDLDYYLTEIEYKIGYKWSSDRTEHEIKWTWPYKESF